MSSEQKEEESIQHKIGKLKYPDEVIDKMISNISLLPPKKAFDIFYEEIDIIGKPFASLPPSIKSNYKNQFAALPPKKRNIYIQLEKADEVRFNNELKLIKKYLVPIYYTEGKSAEEIFIEDYINNHIKEKTNNVEDEAKEEWEKLNEEEKAQWNELKKENDQWWKEANSYGSYNTLSVFDYFKIVKKKQAEEKGIEIINEDVETLWNRISENKLKEYIERAKKENAKRKEYREIIDIESRAPPQQPLSGYRLFVQATIAEYKDKDGNVCKKKNNVFKYANELWNTIEQKEREKYIALAHRQELLYRYKEIRYYEKINEKESQLQKENESLITGKDVFIKEHINEGIPIGKTPKEYYDKLWDNLEINQKERYIKDAEKINAGEATITEILSNSKNQKKPRIGYQVFFKEKIEYTKKNKEEISPKKEEKKESMSDKENKKRCTVKIRTVSNDKRKPAPFISLNN